jgi:hypothetical protein
MARQGIYVGGREIVERFVGRNSVWKKYTHWRTLAGVEVSTEFNDRMNEAYFYNYRGGFDSFELGNSNVVKVRKGTRVVGYIELQSLHFHTNVKLVMRFKNSADFYEMKSLLGNGITYVTIEFYRKG